jgi:hypothetical protein
MVRVDATPESYTGLSGVVNAHPPAADGTYCIRHLSSTDTSKHYTPKEVGAAELKTCNPDACDANGYAREGYNNQCDGSVKEAEADGENAEYYEG